jgi:hypothetical protein
MTVFLPFSRPTARPAPFILVSAPLQSDAAACTNPDILLAVRIVAALAEAGYSIVESPKADLDAQQR